MHLTDADIGAALDPIEGGAPAATAHAHAATCADCHDSLRRAQAADRDVADLFHVLDHAAPPLDFASILRRAAEVEPPPRVKAITVVVRRSAIILGLSAAAAAALPPVRHFIVQLAGSPPATGQLPAPGVPSPSLTAADAPAVPRGVAIVADGRADLVFRTAQPGGVLSIRPTLAMHVSVTASADGPTYSVGRGTIIIDTPATGMTYDIELPPPARLPDVTIRIGDHVVFARHGAAVHTDAPRQADGSYRIAMSDEHP